MIADLTRAINSARGDGVHTPLPAPGVPFSGREASFAAATRAGADYFPFAPSRPASIFIWNRSASESRSSS
jgi:hypothetical protein